MPLVATCHCGAIRIHVRRISRTVTIDAPKDGLATYSWRRKTRAYYRCKKCGCVTHYAYRRKRRSPIVAVNAVNFEPSALAGVRIRRLDGAASWKFLD
jgi:hypothetical protein